MKFEEININQIKPAEYNPRIMPTNEMEKLKNNLKTYGLIDPILVDLTDDNTVIGGHQRLEALKEIQPDATLKLLRLGDLGLIFNETEIKIKDKNDQKSMNLSLNKIQGDWDYKKLDDILLELSEENYQIELTRFDATDISYEFNSDLDLDETIEKIEDNFKIRETEEEYVSPKKKNNADGGMESDKSVNLNKILKLEILFKTEEEMMESFDKLVEKGYNVRMSNS